MSNVYLGTPINWGTANASVTNAALGTFTVQGVDYATKGEVEKVKDGNGATVAVIVSDPYSEASFEGFIKGTGLADAITQTKICPIGTLVTVADTSHGEIAASTWIVMDASIKRTNTKMAMISLKLEKYAGITAVASA